MPCRYLISLLLLAIPLFPSTPHAAQASWDSEITLRPQAPKAGEPTTFMVVVKAGREGARNLVITGGIDGDRRFNYRIDELRPDRSKRLRFSWRATAGRHSVQFNIQPQSMKQRGPLKISHNFLVTGGAATAHSAPGTPAMPRMEPQPQRRLQPQLGMTLAPQQAELMHQPTCDGTPLPDLVITNVSVSGNGYPGAPHSINVTVQNRGQCDSGIFSVRVEVLEQVPATGIYQTREVGHKGFPSLKPCRSEHYSEAEHSASFDYTLRPDYHAYYDFSVEVDDTHSVEEFNEDNNALSRIESIEVKAPEYYGQ